MPDMLFGVLAGVPPGDSTVPVYTLTGFHVSEVTSQDTVLFTDSFGDSAYAYINTIIEEGDTILLSIVSVDTTAQRLKVELLPDMAEDAEPGDQAGMLFRNLSLEPETDFTIKVHLTGEDRPGVAALAAIVRNYDFDNVEDLVSAQYMPSLLTLHFNSRTDSVLTLVISAFADSTYHYYIDSVEVLQSQLQLDSLYSYDFSSGIDGWRASFLETDNLQLGSTWWQEETSEVSVYTRAFGDDEYTGAIYRPITVQPGLLHRAEVRLRPAHVGQIEANLLLFNLPAEGFNVNTALETPAFSDQTYILQTDTTIHLNFVPSQEQMTMVMATTMTHPGAMIVGAVRVYALDTLLRTPLLTDAFNTDSSSIAPWRNSLLLPAEATATLTIGELSHDTIGQRMRVDMTLFEYGEPTDDPMVQGMAARHVTGLQQGATYHLSFTADTTGSIKPEQLQLILFTQENIDQGLLIPYDEIALYDGQTDQWSDTLQTTFSAPDSNFYLVLIATRMDTTASYLYIDNYALREGFILGYNCDPDNLADVEDRWGYRYGFNSMERDDEVKGAGNSLDFGARIYDSRTGRWLSRDKIFKPHLTSYQFGKNSPIIYIDPDGNDEYLFHANGTWSVTRQSGPDVFKRQDTDDGPYRVLNSTLPDDFTLNSIEKLSDLNFIAQYSLDNNDFNNDLNDNQGEGDAYLAHNILATYGWVYITYYAYDVASNIFSLGGKAVGKEFVKDRIYELDEVVVTSAKYVKNVKELGKAKYGRYKIIFKDGSEYVGKTVQEFRKRIGQHFGKNGTFAGKIDDVQEIVYEELKHVKRKALKFKEQEWIDDAIKSGKEMGKDLLNKINAARKQKKK